MRSLSRMSTWRHHRQKLSWNFEVLVSNSGYAPALRHNKNYMFENSKYTWLGDTSLLEVRVLIALVYIRGLYNINYHCICILFSSKVEPPIFGAVMSHQWMKFLLLFKTFDNYQERQGLWADDRFAAGRPLFELFNSNYSKYVVPSDYLSIDKSLYPMQHQIAFWQYNINKPDSYGLLLKSINDARFPFTYKASPHTGKPQNGDGLYCIDKTEKCVTYLLNEVEIHQSLKERNKSTDILYISISLANWLLSRDITTVGTLNTNRVGISKELKDIKGREEFSVICHFEQ